MEATLDIDDDVLEVVQELALSSGRSVGEVISDLVRQELTGDASGREAITSQHVERYLDSLK